MITFLVGSASKRKINSIKPVISELLNSSFELNGIATDSGVPETPWDKETKLGAYNRASSIKDRADVAIGLESGLVERYGEVYEESWCCIINSGVASFGYSSGLKIPEVIIRHIRNDGLAHNEVMPLLRKQMGLEDKRDTWGDYTGQVIMREESLKEAFRNALVQSFTPPNSMYAIFDK